MSALLPLFPLDLVLFPGTPLPLHIFEPRYREMVGECLAQKAPFGVVRVKDEGIADIGCTAEIVTVTKKYEDGRMDIVTQGLERFEVMQLHQERSFLQAEVVYLADDPGKASPDEVANAVRLHNEILSLAGAEPHKPSTEELIQLSFRIAGSMPLDLDFKQNLLAMSSEPERLRTVITYFESILPNLRRTLHVRRKAGGNGHAG